MGLVPGPWLTGWDHKESALSARNSVPASQVCRKGLCNKVGIVGEEGEVCNSGMELLPSIQRTLGSIPSEKEEEEKEEGRGGGQGEREQQPQNTDSPEV